MPFFQTLDRTCLHLGSLSDLSWKMVAKREPPGAPKIPIFLTFSPKAPQALQDPLPRRLRGSFFHDFGINFKISDQQKHYFEDHSLIILAFIFTISDQRKYYFGDYCLIILALILMASDQQKHYNKSNSHAHKPTRTRTRTYTFTFTCTSTCTRKRTRNHLSGP